MHEDNKEAILATVSRQRKEAMATGAITCTCGRPPVPVIDMFRCYYCGVYHCPACAPSHFGGERGRLPGEQILMRINLLSDGDIILLPDGTIAALRDVISMRSTHAVTAGGERVDIDLDDRFGMVRLIETAAETSAARMAHIVEMLGKDRVPPLTHKGWEMPPPPKCDCGEHAIPTAYLDEGWHMYWWCKKCDDMVQDDGIDWPFSEHQKARPEDMLRVGFQDVETG